MPSLVQKEIKGFFYSLDRDDCGRLVAEVYHVASGKTLGITEVDNAAAGEWWAKKLIDSQGAEISCPADDPFGRPDFGD